MTWLRRVWIAVALATIAACGGGRCGCDLADLTGTWLLTPTESGIEGDAVHLTLVQAGTSLSATATCNLSLPVGAGSWDGTAFLLAFDSGGGNVLTLTGAASGHAIAGSFSSPDGTGTFVLARTSIVLDCAHACDPVTVAPFVSTDFTDLSLIEEISLFRSSAGHDYSDGCETCRSMKHYFSPFLADRANGVVPVRSPVAGTITSVTDEHHGASPPGLNKQVRIRSSLHPEVSFVLFHTDLEPGIAAGSAVLPGDLVGHARLYYDDLMETAHDFDIAVRVHTLYGDRYVSWFDVVTDALFAEYVARGAVARSDFVLSKAARDADPLTCAGETFTSAGALPAWFVLGPP